MCMDILPVCTALLQTVLYYFYHLQHPDHSRMYLYDRPSRRDIALPHTPSGRVTDARGCEIPESERGHPVWY